MDSDSDIDGPQSGLDLISSVLIPAAISSAGNDINFSGLEEFEEVYIESLKRQVQEIHRELDLESLSATRKKKRKRYYIPVKLFPRILKNDIRRDYAKMMVNVFNSGSDVLMRRFLTTYGIPDCQFVRISFQGIVFNVPATEYVEGIDNIVPVFYRQIRTFPDLAVRLDKSIIIPSMDKTEGSKVVFVTTVNFTRLFQGISLSDIKQFMAKQQQQQQQQGSTPMQQQQQHQQQQHQVPRNAFQFMGNIPLPNVTEKQIQWKSWIVPHSASELATMMAAPKPTTGTAAPPVSAINDNPTAGSASSSPVSLSSTSSTEQIPPPLTIPPPETTTKNTTSSPTTATAPTASTAPILTATTAITLPPSPTSSPSPSSSPVDSMNPVNMTLTTKIEQIIQQVHRQKLHAMGSNPIQPTGQLLSLQKPIEITRSCRVTMCLDEFNRLYRIEVYPLPPTQSSG